MKQRIPDESKRALGEKSSNDKWDLNAVIKWEKRGKEESAELG